MNVTSILLKLLLNKIVAFISRYFVVTTYSTKYSIDTYHKD